MRNIKNKTNLDKIKTHVFIQIKIYMYDYAKGGGKMSVWLTTKQVMQYFNVKDSRTIAKFRKQGLKFIEIGSKDYRYKQEDVEEFAEHKIELAQEKIRSIYPIKRKTKCKKMNVDYEKIRINRELNRVV